MSEAARGTRRRYEPSYRAGIVLCFAVGTTTGLGLASDGWFLTMVSLAILAVAFLVGISTANKWLVEWRRLAARRSRARTRGG